MHSSVVQNNKPHAVCIPFPGQGHVNPMLKLAKLLHHNGFHITFVNSEINHKRFLKSGGSDSLNGLHSFRFETIPDGLPLCDVDDTQDLPSLFNSTESTCLAPFRNLLERLNDRASIGVPPVTCIVYDGTMTFAHQAARELGIPGVLLWTASACGYYAYTQYANLIEKGYIPLKDEGCLTNGYLDTIIECVPSMKGIRLRDFPSFVRTLDIEDFMIKYVLQQTERAREASAILLNTFDDLETESLKALSYFLPPIFTIGPLHLLENQVNDAILKDLGSSLWTEEPECLEWLDSQQSNSVIYVNFGSVTVMSHDQLNEFAWGLADSNQMFLWVIRPNLVTGEKVVLPPKFLESTKERGMIASWCPQEKVLSKHSIAGFLTHSGWNSTLESISNGVPMICWPFFGEQQTNCWYCCEKLGIGMEIDNNVKRNEVENIVRELAYGDKGKEMKKNAMKWKKLAHEVAKSTAHENLKKFISQVLLPVEN